MRNLFFLILMALNIGGLNASTGIVGKVTSISGCSSPVMVWLSLDKDLFPERLLLMHTEVPVGGSFQFFLKKGSYQVRASDKMGCEFFQRIQVGDKVDRVLIKMEKR